MFIPTPFRESDQETIRQFIRDNSFGTIVSHNEGKLLATHLPFVLNNSAGKDILTSHIARANPQVQSLQKMQVLVTFLGSHCYISSSWYKIPTAPTWNYQSVHVYGDARFLSEDETRQHLQELLEIHESPQKNAVTMASIGKEKLRYFLKELVGFEIEITSMEAAFKLSQNHNKEDGTSIIQHLEKSGINNNIEVATAMKKVHK